MLRKGLGIDIGSTQISICALEGGLLLREPNVAAIDPETGKVLEAGHEIGNHTFSHPHLQNGDLKSLTKELKSTETVLGRCQNQAPKLFRPPEGVCTGTVCQAAANEGYAIILWTVDTRDWAHTPADDIVKKALKTIKSGDIILFHDYVTSPSPTPDALRSLIPTLLSEGYQLDRKSVV